MRYLCSLFGASMDDLVTAETPAGFAFIPPPPTTTLTLLSYISAPCGQI